MRRFLAGLLIAAALLAAPVASYASGKALYLKKCASCHGKDGKGKAVMAKVLKTTPAALDLVDAETLAKGDPQLVEVTLKGVKKMPSYAKKLSASDAGQIVAYLRGLTPVAAGKTKAKKKGVKKPTAGAKKLYLKKCASCHGKDGKGKAVMAKVFKIDAALLNLLDKASIEKSDKDLVTVTEKGAGKMPGYSKKLSKEDIEDLVRFIRSLER